jgi:wyosine [tRNA(Phe)-imidazoG37] synthetase (radical SAM superfamily)
MSATSSSTYQRLYVSHPRRWRDFHYIYPVLSRRSKGLSIGVNLNPDKVCNWDCVYCQVDRTSPAAVTAVDLDQLRDELGWMLGWAAGGAVWTDEQFRDVPPAVRRINDIAFSGDGEPTTCPRFDEAVQIAADLKASHGLEEVKLIVLTNMTMAHREPVKRGFALLDRHHGEIWAKLEAGTQAYYEKVDRSAVRLSRILENILDAGRLRPIVIQSMFMQLHGQPVPSDEFEAYLDRLQELVAGGCQIKLVQLYTIARQTAEAFATPLGDEQLLALADRLRHRLPQISCETYPAAHVA